MLLTWPHPFDITPRSATLRANGVVVATDVPWGAFEDEGNASDTEVTYTVDYLSPEGAPFFTVNSTDIRRVPRLPSVCAIRLALISPEGFPDANRIVNVSDFHEPTVPENTRRYAANTEGEVLFFARRGTRLYVHLENAAMGLDTMVPDLAFAGYAELKENGSVIVHDRRGWY